MNKQGDDIQHLYANTLHWIAIIGFIFLVLSFIIYVLGILPPLVEPSTIPDMWHLPADEYVELNRLSTGWDWVDTIAHGDIIAMSSLFFLATGTIICFAVILVMFIKRRIWPYAIFTAAEIIVLLLAAGGIVTGSH